MALTHSENLQWVENDPHPLDKTASLLFEEFLIRSPALEVSCRSDGLIDRFHISDSDDAEALFETLMDNVCYLHSGKKHFAASTDEVESLLIQNDCYAGNFWEKGEFAIYVVPNEAKKQVRQFVGSQISSNVGLRKRKRELVQAKFQKVDSLFRHIRNALAHGSFQIKEVKNGQVIILQDGNTRDELSARMVLRTERLRSWVTLFYQYEASGV